MDGWNTKRQGNRCEDDQPIKFRIGVRQPMNPAIVAILLAGILMNSACDRDASYLLELTNRSDQALRDVSVTHDAKTGNGGYASATAEETELSIDMSMGTNGYERIGGPYRFRWTYGKTTCAATASFKLSRAYNAETHGVVWIAFDISGEGLTGHYEILDQSYPIEGIQITCGDSASVK